MSLNAMTLPDGPSTPRIVQGGIVLAAPFWAMRQMRDINLGRVLGPR